MFYFYDNDDERDISEQTADKATDVGKRSIDYISGSNPFSKRKQKENIKKSYYEKSSGETVYEKAKEYIPKAKEKITLRLKEGLKDKKIYFIVIGSCFFIMFAATVLSVTTTLFQSVSASTAMSTYLSSDSDLISAREYYKKLQNELEIKIKKYEENHSYDEYHYTLGEIKDDPYGIISILSAYSPGFEYPDICNFERKVFNTQYVLTETIKKETRYRQVVDYVLVTEPNNQGVMLTYWKRVETYEPYEYKICYLNLSSMSVDAVAKKLLKDDLYDLYSVYVKTKGNREDLF